MTRVHLITGSFGAGKTTTIRWLMRNKPAAELWVVILNEFTDAGIDSLNVAQDARGSFDVRLVAGGCLCCVGELEFGKQLRDILKELKPARVLIEPSGAGHAADIVDILSLYERQGALRLDSIICLVDPIDAERILRAKPDGEWSQIQSADALLLSKPDLAKEVERAAFDAIAAAQYPPKRYVGTCSHGELPAQVLVPFEREAAFSLLGARSETTYESHEFQIGGLSGSEAHGRQLGLWAVQWQLPAQLTFARVLLEPQLRWQLDANQGLLRRMKGVFRTGPGPSWLVQGTAHGLSAEDSAYRRDSRVEVVLAGEPTPAFMDEWRRMLREAANPR